ncbi:unnamed protein product [Rotaria magnacalcarata]|uniref:U1 small nuclear ribonucleoprotein 70 kDa n=3 Tax=Rotaria magnacalcarata TaxID=392030 RepID=A0A814GHS0_9BILA|nr:unnamed protein product [Rotaria magnacalcarata]CAF1631877.1 unnamed protein product [Rotaria magnacalcarata]CAF1914386.1 unnamed protein product [Rotaria magnacalcarata]CAF1954471.1 unnamed protein product [Rotaria magnacalcarata]CAF2086732.1 unnamed protein product [Rotaria magnacalcarata]
MTQFLPPNLLALFAPREAIPFLPPNDKLPHEKKRLPYGGLGDFLPSFEQAHETPPPTRIETKEERVARKANEKAERAALQLEQNAALWDPNTNEKATADPYKTLFIARLNYDTSETKLKREFEVYGKIKSINLVHDTQTGKPRGYAFIEYEKESDMHAAYKRANERKIDGRRVVVDVERGRTVKGWRPRRLGGGLGATRRGGTAGLKRSAGEERRRSSSRDRKRRSRSRDRRRSRSREHKRRRTRSRSAERRSDRRSSRERPDTTRRRSRDRDRGDRGRRSGNLRGENETHNNNGNAPYDTFGINDGY